MPLNILYSKPGHLIRRAHQIAVALFMEECAGYDITPVQYATLVAIRETPGIAAIQAFGHRGERSGDAGRVEWDRTSGGEEAGEPAHDAADKRAKCLFLTKEGQALVETIEPAPSCARRSEYSAPLGARDRKTFVRLLDQMVETNNHASRAPRGPMLSTTRRGTAKTA